MRKLNCSYSLHTLSGVLSCYLEHLVRTRPEWCMLSVGQDDGGHNKTLFRVRNSIKKTFLKSYIEGLYP